MPNPPNQKWVRCRSALRKRRVRSQDSFVCVSGVIWGAETPNFHSCFPAPHSLLFGEDRVSSGRAAAPICTSATFPLESFSRILSFHLQNFRRARTIGVLSGWQTWEAAFISKTPLWRYMRTSRMLMCLWKNQYFPRNQLPSRYLSR